MTGWRFPVDAKDLPPVPGKFASTVRVGDKGQIVIPKGARDLFGIQPGDTLLLLADVEQGIAIVRQDVFDRFIAGAMPPAVPKEEDPEPEGDPS
jgi:AbrB family looped-hinge helix DNA binding protein